MTKFNKIAALSAALILGAAAGDAHATTLDVLLNSSGGTASSSVNASQTAYGSATIDLAGGSVNTVTNSQVIQSLPNSVLNQYTQPSGPIFGSNGGSYLAVLGTPDHGLASITPNVQANDVSFTWGSIDSYNTLTILASNATYTITGTELAALATNGGLAGINDGGNTQADVSFFDPYGVIQAIEFASTNNSFEVANVGLSRVAPTPLPGSLGLFLTALTALSLFAFRHKSSLLR